MKVLIKKFVNQKSGLTLIFPSRGEQITLYSERNNTNRY